MPLGMAAGEEPRTFSKFLVVMRGQLAGQCAKEDVRAHHLIPIAALSCQQSARRGERGERTGQAEETGLLRLEEAVHLVLRL